MRRLRLIALLAGIAVAGCTADETSPETNDTSATDDALVAPVGTCVVALGQGAFDEGADLVRGIVTLPHQLAELGRKIGADLVRARMQVMLAMREGDLQGLVQRAVDAEERKLAQLALTLKGAIPALRKSLESGAAWFKQLSPDAKARFVCGIVGRVAFEVVLAIVVDKGLGLLANARKLTMILAIQDEARAARVVEGAAAIGEDLRVARVVATSDPLGKFGSLLSHADYEALFARQSAGEILDLARVPRPAIAASDPRSGLLRVVEGAGRWEKTAPADWMDLFVPHGTPVPSGAVLAEQGVPAEVVRMANGLSSRGALGANMEFVDFLTDGKTFDRLFIKSNAMREPATSAVRNELGKLLPQVRERFGTRLDDALAALRYEELPPAEKLAALKDLALATPPAH